MRLALLAHHPLTPLDTMDTLPQVRMVPLDEIVVGTRHRLDLGDLSELASSLNEIGMLQPVGVTPAKALVFGGRRLAAAKLNGWDSVPVVVLHNIKDVLTALRAERDENQQRKEMLPSELVSLGLAIKAIEAPAAAARSAANLAQNTEVELVPPRENKGKTRDVIGEALGVSGRHFEQAETVVEHGVPELIDVMDAGVLSVKVAAEVAKLPAEVQHEITSAPDVRAAAKAAISESKESSDADDSPEESPSESNTDRPRRKLPKHFVPGGKPIDPEHPFVNVLNALTALSAAITKAMASEHGDKLKAYLTAIQVGKFPSPQLVEHRAIWVEGKSYGARFIGFRGLRRIVKLAGFPGKPKTAEKLREEFVAEGDE